MSMNCYIELITDSNWID